MRIVDLTMPIYEGMPFGNLWPYERPVKLEVPVTWEKHDMMLYNLTMFCEPGTRLLLPSLGSTRKGEAKVDEVDLSKLVLRDTVILDVPKRASEAVMADEVEAAFSKANIHPGDGILLRTGWGDNERYFKMGDDFILKTPYYSDDGAKRLVELMKGKGCDLFFYDVASMGFPRAHLIPEWVQAQPRKPGWPSSEAKAYVDTYVGDKLGEDWGGVTPLGPARIVAVGGVVNCGAIAKSRVKTISLPLKVKGVPVGPCSCIAIEE